MIALVTLRRLAQKTINKEFLPYREDYLKQLSDAMQLTEDAYILEKAKKPLVRKVFALRLKYGEDISSHITVANGVLKCDGIPICNLTQEKLLVLPVMEYCDGKLIVAGNAGLSASLDYEIYFEDQSGKRYSCNNFPAYDADVLSIGLTILHKLGYRYEIPVEEVQSLTAYIEILGEKVETRFAFGKWSKISSSIRSSYWKYRDILVARTNNGRRINIKRNASAIKYEVREFAELVVKKKMDIAILRVATHIRRRLKKKPVWLFIDRVNYANENSEFLFEYVSREHASEVDAYYVMSGTSPEFESIQKKGKVLEFYSKELRNKYLITDKYVISQTSDFIMIPSIIDSACLRDLFPPVSAYMQHGVLEKDISKTQNKLVTDFSIFVTSAYPEYEYMFLYPYGYMEHEVILSGLARHDLILPYAETKGKELIIAPTWRHNIGTRMDRKKGGRGYNHEFIHSDFYKFYNDLINDNRISSLMEEKGYRGVLRLHPYMRDQGRDFQLNNLFEIADGLESYEKQFENCGLLVTDYSSIAADYAYAAKPVIYAQFDKDTFYEGHCYEEGFFNYEEDGFGPVCYDYESTVAAILVALENDCIMEDKYLERRKKFFAHFDGKNRERIYQAICEAE